jgi:hypothetical protein
VFPETKKIHGARWDACTRANWPIANPTESHFEKQLRFVAREKARLLLGVVNQPCHLLIVLTYLLLRSLYFLRLERGNDFPFSLGQFHEQFFHDLPCCAHFQLIKSFNLFLVRRLFGFGCFHRSDCEQHASFTTHTPSFRMATARHRSPFSLDLSGVIGAWGHGQYMLNAHCSQGC